MLPVDLQEIHRQRMWTMFLFNLFGAPICSLFARKPPTRVLEVGYGLCYWSTLCHSWFVERGHLGISFTGIDINSNNGNNPGSNNNGAVEMKWHFVQHDIRYVPWPFPGERFDLIIVKGMSLATTTKIMQPMMDQCLRILAPGGTLAIWESDHAICRVLEPSPSSLGAGGGGEAGGGDEVKVKHEAAAAMGVYMITANTPQLEPSNKFLAEYNQWLTEALQLRSLSPLLRTASGKS